MPGKHSFQWCPVTVFLGLSSNLNVVFNATAAGGVSIRLAHLFVSQFPTVYNV